MPADRPQPEALANPARRTYLSALVTVPLGGALASCAEEMDDLLPAPALEDAAPAATVPAPSTPDAPECEAAVPDTLESNPEPALGNPIVPSNPLRNYVFGPVPLRAATGAANVGVGEAVLRNLTTGRANTAVGDQAMWQQQDGFNCVAVGSLAMFGAVSCIDCTAIGTGALQAARDGVGATAVGRYACSELVSALNNSGFGDSALRYTTSGVANTAVGYRAAEGNVDGSGNVTVGSHAALGVVGGDGNVVVGFRAMSLVESVAFDNVAVGSQALLQAFGDRNVALGASAGSGLTSGQSNVFIGFATGSSNAQKPDVTNSIAIGDQTCTTKDNQVVIGNEMTESFVLGGITITRAQLTGLLALVSG